MNDAKRDWHHDWPLDWPKPETRGAVDLDLHDLPHASSQTEWWYVNSHLTTRAGRRLSLFAAFFRVRIEPDPVTKAARHSHFLTWALSDVDAEAYYPVCEMDEHLPKSALERLRQGRGSRDPRVNRAMREILERGNVPLPDRRLPGEVFVAQRKLDLDYGGNRFSKRQDGDYEIELHSPARPLGIRLVLHPQKPAIRHGDDGVVRGATGEDMFYYFIPRCAVSGTVTIDGADDPIVDGSGWYDHEFGAHFRELSSPESKPADKDDQKSSEAAPRSDQTVAWNWASVQLDDGTDVSAYALYHAEDEGRIAHWTIVSDPDGTRHAYDETTLEPSELWRSTRTFHDYPLRWHLRVPGARIDLTLDAAFADQEIITVVSKPAFWEGRVRVTGHVGARAVEGLGYVERSGFEPIRDLDAFFTAVSREVRRSVEKLYPLSPSVEHTQDLIASEDRPHYMAGVDPAQIGRALLAPVREITDRGGKAWRSYALLACCDVVLGDSRDYVRWLALPELMHVGSLVVDDVQDRSLVRRGGPASHVIHGDAKAINAGTAAYFIAQRLLSRTRTSATTKLRLYDLYFEAMRAGHAGQAIDLDGLDAFMPAVVDSGDASGLEERVLAIHRLKTAAAAGALARMGAVAGEGNDSQVEAVGRFFESLGLAFQIVDDVLNLRGFRGDLKTRAEDIAQGKITLPIAKAMGRLDEPERRWLWSTLQSKPSDPAVLSAVVEKLEEVGAIEACAEEARELVESAWAVADPLLPDSLFKIMLRAFGWYILERQY